MQIASLLRYLIRAINTYNGLQHLRSIETRPLGLNTLTEMTSLPQNLQIFAFNLAAALAVTFVFDLFPASLTFAIFVFLLSI